jgi:hypothetical protein
MSLDRDAREFPREDPWSGRLFMFEPGWHVRVKKHSEREFCHMKAPGQDFHHRLQVGELFLAREDERLCLACAERRGLLSFQPRGLRPSLGVLTYEETEPVTPYDAVDDVR